MEVSGWELGKSVCSRIKKPPGIITRIVVRQFTVISQRQKIFNMKTYKTQKTHFGINATKRIVTGLVLAVSLIFLRHDAVAAADTTPPTVSFTVPANAATGVATDEKIAAAFSEPMDPRTIAKETFTLKRGAKKVPGKVSYVGVTATFEPAGNHLEPNTAYTAAITTGARDLAGNALASSFVWSFT